MTVLDTQRWKLFCSPRLSFAPPPFWQYTHGWRGKWDVQYVHSLATSPSGDLLVGMEFENRCPTMVRVRRIDFETLVDATIAGAFAPDPDFDEDPIKLSERESRLAF